MADIQVYREPRHVAVERLWRERAEADRALREVARDMTPYDLEVLLRTHGWKRDGEDHHATYWRAPNGGCVRVCPRRQDAPDYVGLVLLAVESVMGGDHG